MRQMGTNYANAADPNSSSYAPNVFQYLLRAWDGGLDTSGTLDNLFKAFPECECVDQPQEVLLACEQAAYNLLDEGLGNYRYGNQQGAVLFQLARFVLATVEPWNRGERKLDAFALSPFALVFVEICLDVGAYLPGHLGDENDVGTDREICWEDSLSDDRVMEIFEASILKVRFPYGEDPFTQAVEKAKRSALRFERCRKGAQKVLAIACFLQAQVGDECIQLPVKRIAEAFSVSIQTASEWVELACRTPYLEVVDAEYSFARGKAKTYQFKGLNP